MTVAASASHLPLRGARSSDFRGSLLRTAPVPYKAGDALWSNDVIDSSDAVDRHGYHSHAPPPGHFYGELATGRSLAEREARRR